MKLLKLLVFNVLAALLVLEGVSCAYFTFELSRTSYRPSYLSDAHASEYQWYTEHHAWGAWHQPHGRAFKQRPCFSIDLIANSYGARDKERQRESDAPRVVLLGDSFVEGYGVAQHLRFGDLLEERLDREFLNFGAAGNFGPLQYALLYRDLAKTFAHHEVLVALLPDNDFTDNDPDHWKRLDPERFQRRYRPYWVANEAGFDAFYPTEKPKAPLTFAAYRSDGGGLPSRRSRLFRLFWTYGAFQEVSAALAGRTLEKGSYSGYFDATQTQIDSAKFYLKEIKRLAAGRPVNFFTIPRLADLHRLKSERSDVVAQFQAFAVEEGLGYVDLAPAMQRAVSDPYDLFLSCDGHWGPLGHQVAAELLAEAFYTAR